LIVTKLLDGKKIRDEILAEIADEVTRLEQAPRLSVVQVGGDPASSVYIRNKMRACERTGIIGEHHHLPDDCSQETLDSLMRELSAGAPDGIILQLPLPAQLDENQTMALLDPDKDVDGFHPLNLGRLVAGIPGPLPCTPAGVAEMLSREGIETRGKEVVILGRSTIVGKPAALLFLRKGVFADATVTVCHSASQDLPAICRRADILIAAVGRAKLVQGDWVKEGAVVVDVGINRMEDPEAKRGYRLVGDCDFDAIAPKAAAITPVPGGVGPLTVALLLKNTLEAARRRSARVGA
jgi:methylenetetrahydrofolate dehydrogenase (NADP+) / methenyltetrahydrofolate cyclohydrolase